MSGPMEGIGEPEDYVLTTESLNGTMEILYRGSLAGARAVQERIGEGTIHRGDFEEFYEFKGREIKDFTRWCRE